MEEATSKSRGALKTTWATINIPVKEMIQGLCGMLLIVLLAFIQGALTIAHVNIKILVFWLEGPSQAGTPGTMDCRILMFMWSCGPQAVWFVQLGLFRTFWYLRKQSGLKYGPLVV